MLIQSFKLKNGKEIQKSERMAGTGTSQFGNQER